MLRADDEALLARLEDEELCERLWRAQAPHRAPPALARASGLVTLVCQGDAGGAARARALRGELGPLLARLAPSSTRGLDPRLNHHLALWFERLAEAYRATSDEAAHGAAIERALASWLALADEREHLLGVATRAAGPAAPAADVARVAAEAPFGLLRALGRAAEAGAKERSADGRRALDALARVEHALAVAGASEATARRASALARELETRAIEEALAPLANRLEALVARGAAVAEGPALFEDVRAAWEWSRRSRTVEHFAVDQVTPVAWVAYKLPGWDALAKLVRPLDPLVDSLVARLEASRSSPSTTDLAYAAPAAQMLVFRSELARGTERFAHVERALRLCPPHRNARVVLSGLLCEEALRLLQGGLFVRPEARAEARRHHDRAKELFPQQRKLPEVAKALGLPP